MRYIPTTSVFHRKAGDNFDLVPPNPLFLMSGVDRSHEVKESNQLNNFSLGPSAAEPLFKPGATQENQFDPSFASSEDTTSFSYRCTYKSS